MGCCQGEGSRKGHMVSRQNNYKVRHEKWALPGTSRRCATYRIKNNDEILQGSCDDGEHSASNIILQAMIESGIIQQVIFVVRYFSGVKIGKARFTCIQSAVQQCMELYPNNRITGNEQKITFPEPQPRFRNDQNSSRGSYRGRGGRGGRDNRIKYASIHGRVATSGRGAARGSQPRSPNDYKKMDSYSESLKRRRSSSGGMNTYYRENRSQYKRLIHGDYRDYDEQYPPIQGENWSSNQTGAWHRDDEDIDY